jgi:hypothetical protein
MLIRKPLPIWISVSLFAVSVATAPQAVRMLRRPAEPPRTLAELVALLSHRTPPLYTVRQFENSPENGMWVCVRPRSREEFPCLIRAPEYAHRWEGLVFVERNVNSFSIPDDFIRDKWGVYGTRVGPFVLFGDPEVLQRIRPAIEEGSRN